MVVGEQDLGDMPRAVVRAANLFDAVGEVTSARAGEPVAAVIVPAALVRDSASITVEAFRRIDPSVRLILVASSEHERSRLQKLKRNGFDDVLVQPVSARTLSAVLDDGHDRPQPDRGSDEPVVIEAIAAEPSPAGPPTTTARTTPTEDLGDTDLVEAILNDPSGLRDQALRLMVQQTGWSDLVITDAPPEGLASVELRYGPRCYGMLSSGLTEVRQLRPWGQWLARWMALDNGYREYRTMAYRDDITGAWNRRFYDVFMKGTLRKAARLRRAVTVLVFDIDDFKRYNDDFGHEAGDEVLRETVKLLESVIRSGDRVCRIGGDEFVVIFADPEGPRQPGSNPPETVEVIATRFQDQVCRMRFPKLGLDAPGTLSISGGLAAFPWDGTDAASLLRHADQLALQSKREGKNLITFGPRVERRSKDKATERQSDEAT